LQYRLEKYRTLSLPEITPSEPLYSRSRDLYEALALPTGECKGNCEQLLAYFTFHHQISSREPLYPTHAAVLEYLYYRIHEFDDELKGPLPIGGITCQVSDFLQQEGEHFRLNPRQVGAALTALGLLTRKRTRRGWQILLDRPEKAHIHQLIHVYGKEHYQTSVNEYGNECEFCFNLLDPRMQEMMRNKNLESTG
jgi:hypothetical protein